MKKIYVFLVVTGILLFLGVQIAFNQSKSNPISEHQNQIGRYQYFNNPDGSLQGFLDIQEGFVFLCCLDKKEEWKVWDLKEDAVSLLTLQYMQTHDKLRIKIENLSSDEREPYVKIFKEDEERLKSQIERIRK